MSTKLVNTILAIFVLVSSCLANNANAGLILGTIYTDFEDVQWEYIASYNISDGPIWNDANKDGVVGDNAVPVNGLEAAAGIWGLDVSEIALSAYGLAVDEDGVYVEDADLSKTAVVAGARIVNHDAWYMEYKSFMTLDDEGIDADPDDNNEYSIGDKSAYIRDEIRSNETRITYVFKAVTVPEPSTLAIFSLALFGLGARRLKKQ